MSQPTATPAAGAAPRVHITRIARRRALPGREADYEALVREMFELMRAIPGFSHGELLRPEQPGGEYQIFSHWDSEDAVQRWVTCRGHADVLQRMGQVAEAEPEYRHLTGLEAFFPDTTVPANVKPSRARMTFVTWLGIFPTAAFYLWFVAPALAHWPFILRTALVTLLIVYTMGYVVAPWLTRLMKPFLMPSPAKPPQS